VNHIRPFEAWQLNGLEWQQVVSRTTDNGHYRVEITWALDRYRVTVWRRVQEPEKPVERRHPHYAHTTIKWANALYRKYNRRES
jgi:hypothetical protein